MSEATPAGAVTSEPGTVITATPAGVDSAAAAAPPTPPPPPGTALAQPPDETDYEFAAPEGVELNKEDLEGFKAIAKELKLPKDQAQRVVDLAIKREQARTDAFTNQVKAWGDQVRADPELGRPENLALAIKAVEMFGDAELRSVLDSTGMGNHPVIVRAFYKAGKAISEDSIIRGRNVPTSDKSMAEALYGTPTRQ